MNHRESTDTVGYLQDQLRRETEEHVRGNMLSVESMSAVAGANVCILLSCKQRVKDVQKQSRRDWQESSS